MDFPYGPNRSSPSLAITHGTLDAAPEWASPRQSCRSYLSALPPQTRVRSMSECQERPHWDQAKRNLSTFFRRVSSSTASSTSSASSAVASDEEDNICPKKRARTMSEGDGSEYSGRDKIVFRQVEGQNCTGRTQYVSFPSLIEHETDEL